ncbi:hypothetical protein Lche_1531 [Legionella cherrii]|uniref:Secreted protein n=1 Tax=Legionella cherrii TaxID=28084 RepID=A0A0W0S7V7_9GAMM|nr:hypothetical protein [Legionella cherrii]KTC79511.1 hypothetical protein Lche_1531 [Legionella cherrii]
MKRIFLFGVGFLMGIQIFALNASTPKANPDVNKSLLPSPFPVYILGNNGVINHPYPGAEQAFLPTDNSYTLDPGCYIACYSHNQGVYPVAENIYVMGQIRVRGRYVDRICQPEGYKGIDISTIGHFKFLCSVKIDACKNNSCWAGGDTGGWFGVQ